MGIVLVLARADNGVIGRDGGLPWRLPADLRRFKALTLRVVAAEQLRPARALRPERREQGGGIDLELVLRPRGDIDRRIRLLDHSRPAEQQPTHLQPRRCGGPRLQFGQQHR